MRFDVVKAINGCLYVIDFTPVTYEYPMLVIEKLTTGEYDIFQVDNVHDIDRHNQYAIVASNDIALIGKFPELPETFDHDEILVGAILEMQYHQSEHYLKLIPKLNNNDEVIINDWIYE